MPTYKGTILFNQSRHGWSESYYLEATGYAEATTRMNEIAGARAQLMGKGNSIDAIRISDESILNDALLINPGSDAPTQDSATDTPWNAIYVRAQAGGQYRRQFHLRGVPDSWIVIDPDTGKATIPAVAKHAFDKWRTAMINLTPVVKLKVHLKEGAGVVIIGPPTAAAGGVFTKFNVPGVPGLATTPYVLLRKWRGPDKRVLNRRYDVISYNDPDLVLSLPFAALSEPAANFGGMLLRRIPGYADMTTLSLLRLAAKKTGKAFFVAPGRSKGKGK